MKRPEERESRREEKKAGVGVGPMPDGEPYKDQGWLARWMIL